MSEVATLTARIEVLYGEIAATRMAGVPVLNPALGVAMRGLRRLGEDWVGVLVTPWFMAFIQIAAEPQQRRIGEKCDLVLPSGRYQAIWNHEPQLGGFWSCSLFSPMFEFADQEAALATADAALAEMLGKPGEDEPGEDTRMTMIWAGVTVSDPGLVREEAAAEPVEGPVQFSRRGLFRLPDEAAGGA